MKDYTPTYYMERNDFGIAGMMRAAGFIREEKIRKADLVLFNGGPDISPYFYGEKRHASTCVNFNRDLQDVRMLRSCASSKLQGKIGICRGAQFLNVMVGNGTLWQNVNNHATGYHDIMLSADKGQRILASSTHHQMMLPGQDGFVVWEAAQATKFEADTWEMDLNEGDIAPSGDPEVILYMDELTLCFQPHPEFTDPRNTTCRELFFDLIDENLLDENATKARMDVIESRKKKGGA